MIGYHIWLVSHYAIIYFINQSYKNLEKCFKSNLLEWKKFKNGDQLESKSFLRNYEKYDIISFSLVLHYEIMFS